MKSLKDILNENSAEEIQSADPQDPGDSGTLIPLKAGKFNRRSLLRTMKKPEGVIQTSSGREYTIYSPKNTQQGFDTSELWLDKSIFAMDRDGVEIEINYDDITTYSETYHEDEAMAIRKMTYDDIEMPKTKIGILTAMKKELRGMKVSDIKASYQYIQAAHCNARESMHGMGTKKDMLTAMMKDLRGMKMADLKSSYGYIKASHCGPHEGAHRDDLKHPMPAQPMMASHCTEETELEEGIDFSKVPDKNLISWVEKFRTVKGNPWSDFKQDMKMAELEIKRRKLKVESIEEATELEEAERMKYDKVIKKLRDGEWESSDDVKQGNHLNYTDNSTGKKKVVFVEANELEEATELYKKGKISFTKFSYGTGKGQGLQINNGIHFIQFSEKNLKDLTDGLKKAMNFYARTELAKEDVELEEMKTKDDDLAVMIYDYIGADTQGLPLKTLITQAVGKYFGSQKDKVSVGGESGFEKDTKEDY